MGLALGLHLLVLRPACSTVVCPCGFSTRTPYLVVTPG